MGSSTVPSSGGGGLEPHYQKFTSSGTFVLPEGYGAIHPLLVNIQVIGGGGGGGGFDTDNVIVASGANVTWEGNRNGYFGARWRWPIDFNTASRDIVGRPGGSGGLAATQLNLTGNLTITVGAAGTTGRKTFGGITGNIKGLTSITSDNNNGTGQQFWNFQGTGGGQFTAAEWDTYVKRTDATRSADGGTGGTSTAGAVEATGGTGGIAGYNFRAINNNMAIESAQNRAEWQDNMTRNVGAGGTPAGSAGDATPLLGTIAGGSTNNTSIRGSFGIGGKKTDANTNTGVEGTGGGASSISASGAVILTWWA